MIGECSIKLLETALAGSLPADEEELLCRHLEDCEACAARMEQMAAEPQWRQEAASLLTVDEFDDAAPAHDEWSEVDFTVEHLEPADEANVLGRIGGYDVLEILGRGGMGVVLKGFDRELKRCVAIKVLAPHLAHSSLAKKRFAREAQAAAAVVHPNVLAIHHVQAGGRLPFLVMPLVAGESLAQRLKAQGPLELKEILRIGMQAAAGLAAAHCQGLVHRDVKPANILLEMGVERAVLTDFGLARAADDVSMTRWGIIAGTPQYMSPEQAKGEPLDGRSDLFSLGCVLYEMATGVSPFRADSAMATMRRLVEESPQALASLNPELPPWFIAIVDRLLEKEPSRRFGTAEEVSDLLEGCLAHLQQPASVPLPAALPKPVLRLDSRRRKSLFTGVIAMLAILGLGLIGWIMLPSQPPPDIAGQWTGEDWGTVVLKKLSDTEYTGTYSDTVGKKAGAIHLKWSRNDGRFNGTWREGEARFGDLSVRLVGNEIRGALTTDAKSKFDAARPKLAELTWGRSKSGSAVGQPKPPGKPDFGGIDPQTVAAWEKAGATFGWIRRGAPAPTKGVINTPSEGGAGVIFTIDRPLNYALPGFAFSELLEAALAELPDPQVPFALDFNVAKGKGKMTDKNLSELNKLKHLHALYLRRNPITDRGMKELAKLTGLRFLGLADNPEITDEGLAELSELTNLQALDIYGTRLTGIGFRKLAGLTKLEELRLDSSRANDAGLKEIALLKGLKSLNLWNAVNITDAGIRELTTLEQLNHLSLYRTKITDTGLKDLATLKSLTNLAIRDTQVTDSGLKELVAHKNLAILSVGGPKISDAGLVHLANLKGLQNLYLRASGVTDAGLKHVATLAGLRLLDLANTKVTDAGLKELTSLGLLQKLDLAGTAVSSEGVLALQRALPKCEITSPTKTTFKKAASPPANPAFGGH